ncbi:putative WRKY transcription factor 26 [Dendrobium catenatum]|uniref:Putative WRKY transcription factor 26 n=1 Tax=Dendrobium catenatum TaxID=906689 RepID=A0A2I0VZV8_9ASPA|nr:putative WRKY transcription factor 26 [Dendrobium catenatum]
MTIQEDDYKWRKYATNYIHKIKKFRSYLRCVNKNCKARKKMDWPLNDPNNIDISYEGHHSHRCMESMASSETTIIGKEEEAKEKNVAEERNNRTMTIQEDDYKWRKDGTHYIHTIKKFRSYLRCVNKNCKARKKMDWSLNDPNNIDISYEGYHNHRCNESMASSETTIIIEEQGQEQNIALAFNNALIVIPKDDYKWDKHGQKFIISIQKNRSYFRCANRNCKARKKVDWPPNELDSLYISYEGDHNHKVVAAGHLENEESGIAAN